MLNAIKTKNEEMATWEHISPQMAKEYLSKMKYNRKSRPNHILRLAESMQKSLFLPTGDSIKFDIDGFLIDGQHRLQAIIKSGCTIKMLVVRNVGREVYKYLDSGAKRNFVDHLHSEISVRNAMFRSKATPKDIENVIFQIKLCNDLIGCADIARVIERTRADKLQIEQKLEFVFKNQEEIDNAILFCEEWQIKFKEKRVKTLFPTSIAALFFICRKDNEKIFNICCDFSKDLFSSNPKKEITGILKDRFSAIYQKKELASKVANAINLREFMQFISAYQRGSRPSSHKGLGQILRGIDIAQLKDDFFK